MSDNDPFVTWSPMVAPEPKPDEPTVLGHVWSRVIEPDVPTPHEKRAQTIVPLRFEVSGPSCRRRRR